MTDVDSKLSLLREEFPPNQINQLPKPYRKDAEKGKCGVCKGFHGLPAAHLDYVGHAALTDRLLDTDLEWTWEPLSYDDHGLPAFDKIGGLWIKLTVAGVTRLGYGHPDGKQGGNAIKEAIGDALRNAGMRFGAGLSLWHKGELHEAESERGGVVVPESDSSPSVGKPDGKQDPLKAKKAEVKAAADKAGVSMSRVSERLVELGFSGPADVRLDVMVLDLLVAWIEEQ